MGFFRRRSETLNERLLREAGLDPAQALGDAPPPVPLELPKSTLARAGVPDGSGVAPREWDAAVTVTAPGLAGNRIEFTTIPNGDVIVGDETGDADLSPLADAVERRVDPPYRAVAQRQDADVWAVAARRIEIAQIPFPEGDRLELSRNGDDEELRVDGDPSDEPVPRELERVGDTAGESFYVEAERIDVAQIPFPEGDRLELSRNGDEEELRVDGDPSGEPVPRELERVGDAAGDSFYVEAERIDGDLWEVRATAL